MHGCLRLLRGRRGILLLGVLLIVLLIGSNPFNLRRAHAASVTYQGTDENFANPERGFFVARFAYYPTHPDWVNVNLGDLQQARSQNITMVRLNYVISDYRTRDLDDTILNSIRDQLSIVRQAGLKAIPRFSYNFGENTAQGWYHDEDAPASQIIRHLDQLKPVLQDNEDVIAFMEAGFIGVWGEWHHTTNNNEGEANGQPTYEANDNTRAIMSKLLEVLPADRMVAERYPRYKFSLYGDTPLDEGTAYGGSNSGERSRVGAHNDCFLASPNDWSTYGDVQKEKDFLNADNRFVPVGGETCNSGADAQPFIGCDNAQKDLEYLRFDTLNTDYEPTVIQGWKNNGCYDTIAKNLGYRFRLTNATLPDSVKPGNTFSMSYTITNDGYGKMYNLRRPEIILRNTQTGAQYRITWQGEDLRYGFGGTTRTVDITAGLPTDMPQGQYAAFLNFPDMASSLHDRPEYSIHLANSGLWEASTGYNSLNATITVDQGADGQPYSGDTWFTQF